MNNWRDYGALLSFYFGVLSWFSGAIGAEALHMLSMF